MLSCKSNFTSLLQFEINFATTLPSKSLGSVMFLKKVSYVRHLFDQKYSTQK